MTKSNLEKEEAFKEILRLIIDENMAIRKAIHKVNININMFFSLLEEDKSKSEQYTRACEIRADNIIEDAMEISDSQENDKVIIDGKEVVNMNNINRNRLQVDTRKWYASKLHPKKYGKSLKIEDISNPLKNLSDEDLAEAIKDLKNIDK